MLFAFFYIGTAFLTSYGTTVIGLSRATVLTMGVVGAVVFGALITLSAVYSDRFGRRKVVLASCLVAIPWGFALFPILDKGTATAFAIGLFGTLAIFAVSYGPAGAMLPEMFRTEYRYTGWITVTATSRDELEAACATVEQAGVRSALELRRVYGEVDQAFLRGCLPLTQGVTP